MGTAINSEYCDKLCRVDKPEFYTVKEALGLEFYYTNEDYDCPNLTNANVKEMLDYGITSVTLRTQLEEIYNAGLDLSLIY